MSPEPADYLCHYRCHVCGPDSRWREGGKTSAHHHLIVFHRRGYADPSDYTLTTFLAKDVINEHG